MIELIRDILTSDAGSFAFVVSLMLLAFWLVYFITRKVTLMNADHSTLAKSVSGIESTVDEMRRDLAYLKGSLDILRTPEQLLKAHSPISLTDEGKRVAMELGAETMISRNWMGAMGWEFQQAYVVTMGNTNVYHWLLKKNIKNLSPEELEAVKNAFPTKSDFNQNK